jgi:hypothetical protein
MNVLDYILNTTAELDEDDATRLQIGGNQYTVTVKPPANASLSATLEWFVRGITEYRTAWFGFRNDSPIISFELRRPHPDTLHLQFAAPTKRMERKIRGHLTEEIGGIQFADGSDGLPVTEGDTIGGAMLTTGRLDRYPIKHTFDRPPINALDGMLHRHAVQNTRVVIQVMCRPIAGQPLRTWWWNKQAYNKVANLRKEKERVWGTRPATPREREQADAVERKAGTSRYHVSIRLVVIGSGDYTPSRIKELSSGFNVYENPDTGQYLSTAPVRSIREKRIVDFAEAVARRRFGSWSRRFQLSVEELAGLIALPDRNQENITTAEP